MEFIGRQLPPNMRIHIEIFSMKNVYASGVWDEEEKKFGVLTCENSAWVGTIYLGAWYMSKNNFHFSSL